jgi:hypothetical protein
MTQFVSVALDLAGKLVDDEVQGVEHLRGGVPCAQGHALQVERALRDLAVGDARIALLEELDLQPGQV